MVFGGDFHQTLPVVPKGICQQVVAASLCRGNLWGHIKFLYLRQNMYHKRSLTCFCDGLNIDSKELIGRVRQATKDVVKSEV